MAHRAVVKRTVTFEPSERRRALNLGRPPQTMCDCTRLPIFVSATAPLSNVVSNVPAVMLLRTAISDFSDMQTGGLMLAMASSLAGNLTITGSVADIVVVEIVVERAAAQSAWIEFRDYFRSDFRLRS